MVVTSIFISVISLFHRDFNHFSLCTLVSWVLSVYFYQKISVIKLVSKGDKAEMSIVSSNMISKHYCPQCDSFDLLKLHRSFLQKRILNTENKLQCRACGEVFKPQAFELNAPREVPVFLSNENPAAATLSEVSEGALDTEMGQHSEPYVRAVEEMPEGDFQVTEINTNLDNAPPEHYGDDQLVDEAIFVKEKKGFWPYVVASLFVLFGAAYAFIWMPMNVSLGETDTIQVDMTIGEPVQMLAEAKQPELVAKIKAEPTTPSIEKKPTLPTEAFKAEGVEVDEPNFQLRAVKAKPAEVEYKLANEAPIETPIKEEIPKVIKPELQVSHKVALKVANPKLTNLKLTNPRLMPDAGTKADRALGGLSIKKPEVVLVKQETSPPAPDASNRLVKVPLLKTYLSEEVTVISNQKSVEPKEIPQKLENKLETATATIAPAKINQRKDILVVQNPKQEAPIKPQQTESQQLVNNTQDKGIKEKPIRSRSEEKLSRARVAVKKEQKPSKSIPFNKKAATLLGVSANDLIALTSTNSSRSGATIKKQSIVQKVSKRQVSDVNTQLVEKAAVKFMEQDLDTLFPQ